MATRSGKTYQEPKRARKRNIIKDTSTIITPNGEYTDHNLDESNISNRDLRSRRSSVKNSTFESDVYASKSSIDNGTESNWIVSDLSGKVNERQSDINKFYTESITCDTSENIARMSESNLNTYNMSTKQLRKRKTHNADTIFNKSDQIVQDTFKDHSKKHTEMTAVRKGRKPKDVIPCDKDKTNEKGRADLNIDIENDSNSLNVDKTVRKKKKKGKGSKKNKQKGKENIEETNDNVKILNTTFEKDNDTRDTSVSNNMDPNTTKINGQKSMDLNSPNISTKTLRSTKSSIKDITFEKDDKLTNTTYGKDEKIDRTFDEDPDLNNSNKKGHISMVLNSPNVSNKMLRNRKSSINTTFEKEDKVADTTYEKDYKVDEILDKNVYPYNSKINQQNSVDFNSPTVSNKMVSNRKSSITNTKFEKGDKLIDTTYEKDDVIDRNFDKNVDNNLKSSYPSNKVLRSRLLCIEQKGKDNIEKTNDNVKILNTTFEKENDTRDTSVSNNMDPNSTKINEQKSMDLNSPNISTKTLRSRRSSIKDITFEKDDKLIITTYEKDDKIDRTFDKHSVDMSSENCKRNKSCITLVLSADKKNKGNYTFEIGSSNISDSLKKSQKSRSSIRDVSIINKSTTPVKSLLSTEILEKDKSILSSPANKGMSLRRQTLDIIHSPIKKLDGTFDKDTNLETESKLKSRRLSEIHPDDKLNVTFDKEESRGSQHDSKSSLISSDNSTISRISITSDESTENIVNMTPLLIESSIDETQVKETSKQSQEDGLQPLTPLKREGTFTKEAPEVPQTPGKHESSIMPPAGCTPYHVSKSSQKKPMLNVTRSIEKRLSVDPGHRMTRVMFCSPIDHPNSLAQEKRKIIKSNLKGSNKSFVFDENLSMSRSARKRSYTQNDADDARTKRSRLAEDLQQSVDRLSRPRTPSTTAKLGETTPKKSNTPYKSKSETKPSRTRLPNFAMLHQKQFDKMESLRECQERKAKRAKQLLTPTASKNFIDKISPKNNTDSQKTLTKELAKPKDKTEVQSKKPLSLESIRPGFTRFGFKLNLNINPFSIPATTEKPKEKVNTTAPKPSLTGATAKLRERSDRREAAKQTVMRETSLIEKRKVNRSENRTIIKGVRTNRRFELQMKLRSID